MLQIWKTQTLR